METRLQRGLGLGSACALVAGTVIGSGVFLVGAEITQAVPHPGAALLVWVVAGIVSLAGGLIFAELGAMYPRAGGQYVYLAQAFHPVLGFLYGWTLVLVIQAGSIAAVSMSFGRFFSRLMPLGEGGAKLAAALVVIGLTWLNAGGVRRAGRVLDGMTALKILALLLLAAAGLTASGNAPAAVAAPAPVTAAGFGVALIAAFWAFDGWNNLGFVAGEVVDPRRNIPRASVVGILSVLALYLLVNGAYYRLLTVPEVAGSPFVAGDALARVMGEVGLPLVAGLVAFSALGCNNALILAGARVIYAMAQSGHLPRGLARVHGTTFAPVPALLAQMVWTLVLIATGTFDRLFTYVVFAAFLFYGLTAAALLRLRWKESARERPYRVPFYPWLPVGYLIFTLLFMGNAIAEKPREALAGAGIVLLGLPAYRWLTRRSRD